MKLILGSAKCGPILAGISTAMYISLVSNESPTKNRPATIERKAQGLTVALPELSTAMIFSPLDIYRNHIIEMYISL